MGKMRRLWSVLVVVASTADAHQSVVDTEETSHRRNALHISFQSESQFPLNEPCTAEIRDIMSKVGRMDLQCSTPSGMAYSIPHVDSEWIEEKQRNHELISGYTELDLPPDTMVNATTHTLILDAPPILRDPSIGNELIRRRRLTTAEKASGTKTVLVVRVEARDTSTSFSESQLASDIFGDNGDPNNLRSQYLACSYGKFMLEKAASRTGVNSNISNGVITVKLPSVSKSVGDTAMLNDINQELSNQFAMPAFKLADFVIYCMPPGVMNPLDVAYAFMDGYRSIYNDRACNQVSTQLHEFGHNLNLAHSSMGGDEYGDKSGMMGYSYEEDDLPYMCFNSAKSWQLGWYTDKALLLNPTPTGHFEFSFKLAGVADYGTTEEMVVIKIEQEFSKWAYFLNYNAGKGINEGTQYGKDRVLVTMKDTTEEGNVSELVARLRVGQNLKIKNFNGRADEELVIRWSAQEGDVASVDVKLRGPNVPQPSESPSLMPSTRPSLSPSSVPTARVTSKPSLVPSSRPSSMPTAVVSEQPTLSRQPTLSLVPSEIPTATDPPSTSFVPSSSPSESKMPSGQPSTNPPSQQPSLNPSSQATPVPTPLPTVSQSPSAIPSFSPSMFPSFVPSDFPSTVPSIQPSRTPSTQPSFLASELESAFDLQLPRGSDFHMVSAVCDTLQAYLDAVTKSKFGNGTITSVTCLPIVEASIRDNVFDRGTDVTAVTTTYFPIARLGPNATEYESHIRNTIASDETMALLPGAIRASIQDMIAQGSIVKMQWDDETFDTPVLKVAFEQVSSSKPSSGMMHHPSRTHLVCILLPSLLLLLSYL